MFNMHLAVELSIIANASKKIENLELCHAIEEKRAAAHEDVELTPAITMAKIRHPLEHAFRSSHDGYRATTENRRQKAQHSVGIRCHLQGNEMLVATAELPDARECFTLNDSGPRPQRENESAAILIHSDGTKTKWVPLN
ncbi:hypothetical protein MRX96_058545 [Rhipicephalus microplus]